jgi:hypothetical protein
MECNIDRRGARVRLVWGIANLMGSAVAAGIALWSGTWWHWMVAGICMVLGVLAVFEARKRWCVVRAMGFKTPM